MLVPVGVSELTETAEKEVGIFSEPEAKGEEATGFAAGATAGELASGEVFTCWGLKIISFTEKTG